MDRPIAGVPHERERDAPAPAPPAPPPPPSGAFLLRQPTAAERREREEVVKTLGEIRGWYVNIVRFEDGELVLRFASPGGAEERFLTCRAIQRINAPMEWKSARVRLKGEPNALVLHDWWSAARIECGRVSCGWLPAKRRKRGVDPSEP
jgi:hypothetical protein